MNSVCREIFRAIYEGRWLSIEYRNKKDKTTRYWIGIQRLNPHKRMMTVDGLHLAKLTTEKLNIYIDSIVSACVIEGSYCERNQYLMDDICLHPHKYQSLFEHVANLKILNYLQECNRMDATPYKCDYMLIHHLDMDSLSGGIYRLSDEQFREIVKTFQFKAGCQEQKLKVQELGMNVLSVHTKRGLYVLAYRKLNLDVKQRMLRAEEDVTICTEFTIDGTKQSIRQFLDADDYMLLDNFTKNEELIKDRITKENRYINGVDDMPYVIAVGRDIILDLKKEFSSVIDMYQRDEVTFPIRAFFGEYVTRPRRWKELPIALINDNINTDQLLAIHNAMKYPLAYIQGPPGSGKTNTILNTIVTALFNERTVLFSSYNNHPIDGVCEKLKNIQYRNKQIPFPILRLGNGEKVRETLQNVRLIYEQVKEIPIYGSTLERNRDDKIERTKRLSFLLKNYEEVLDLKERKETIEKLLTANSQMTFQVDLQGRQLGQVEDRLKEIGTIKEDEVRGLLDQDGEAFRKYLYYTSVRMLQRLREPKNAELLQIINMEEEKEQVEAFHRHLEKDENVKKLLRIFPIVATTCLSAYRLGSPAIHFDMVVIDEASQCNNAVSLVPIIRGKSLMLVGDPQQLKPVIVLDEKTNIALRKKYQVPEEYDYRENSIYKTFLASDAVSDEILLSYHYRCHPKIIEFNNKKYYNGKLKVKSENQEKNPLVYVDVEDNTSYQKNTAPIEAERIMEYIRNNRDKKVGVITPFANQKKIINRRLEEEGLKDVTCGTVHAFQGDEKDVILFSLAVTNTTQKTTYQWLKNNKELINVATSRAKNQLILFSSTRHLEYLHNGETNDDLFELVEYVKSKGVSRVTGKKAESRALGIKPYSTETENAFLSSLSHALDNVLLNERKCIVQKEVAISHVFQDNRSYSDLFYSGRFDFVVYEKMGDVQIPIFAIELDGKEHVEDEVVRERDRKKNEICKAHSLELIRIENSYARRYNYIKEILIQYFQKRH